MKALIITTIISASTLFTGVAQAEVSTRYSFVAANKAAASSICVVAAKDGYSAARNEAFRAGIEVKSISCNGKNIARFARKYSDVPKVQVAKVAL